MKRSATCGRASPRMTRSSCSPAASTSTGTPAPSSGIRKSPPMGVAEMRDLYAWVAANAPGADLFVYSDGGMNEQHARIDAGRTFIMVVSTPVSNDLQRTFPGARIVPYADW